MGPEPARTERERKQAKQQQAIGKKPNIFSCKVSKPPFSRFGVPVGDDPSEWPFPRTVAGPRKERAGMPAGKDCPSQQGVPVLAPGPLELLCHHWYKDLQVRALKGSAVQAKNSVRKTTGVRRV